MVTQTDTPATAIPDDVDPECRLLCEAMNLVAGIRTIESCCGHGERPYQVYFTANSLDSLPTLLYWFAGCHCGYYGWNVFAKTDCAMSPVMFRVEGPVGETAYSQAVEIALLITEWERGAPPERDLRRTIHD